MQNYGDGNFHQISEFLPIRIRAANATAPARKSLRLMGKFLPSDCIRGMFGIRAGQPDIGPPEILVKSTTQGQGRLHISTEGCNLPGSGAIWKSEDWPRVALLSLEHPAPSGAFPRLSPGHTASRDDVSLAMVKPAAERALSSRWFAARGLFQRCHPRFDFLNLDRFGRVN